MNNQEIFDTVSRHLLTQMLKAMATFEGEELCRYRGDNGLKCAVGGLIPDDKYDPKMECSTVLSIGTDARGAASLESALTACGISSDSYSLLADLQEVHDSNGPGDWYTELAEVAEKNDLSAEVLNEF